ncbi:MAG TPA: hydantoinase/oxoprolinase family protein, partial [Syntrophomonas sp.]|nr:hydantoinase/oxoprolinase family protein [Syntrophomonas sp.]
MAYVMGIDAGGTFIDYFLVDQNGDYTSFKTLTKPLEPDYGIMTGLEQLSAEMKCTLSAMLSNVRLIVHGTTVATNAVLTHSGAATALLTTDGLIDLLEMRQGVRDDVYNNHRSAPSPLVDRWLRLPVVERLNYQGEVLTPLDSAQACQQIKKLTNENIESIAIVLAHSYVNPMHECQLQEMIREYMPEVHVSLSHQVLPKAHMYRRVSTTTLDAYVAPVLNKYLQGLLQGLHARGFGGELLIMQSNGGTVKPEEVLQLPAMSILSGPAAGPSLVKHLGIENQLEDAVVVDMGGTSFDVSLVRNGEPGMSDETVIADHLLGLPVVNIHTIGAGGGSLAWVDKGGLLHVGPHSAGARPGPACSGLGGNQPTCTDADLLLGLINPSYFLGGRLMLNVEAARAAVYESVAQPLNIEVEAAALGIYRMINTEMAAGIKEMTLEKGYDPRTMTMVVGGGAGPIHAAQVAALLGMTRLIIPRESSVMCALGMLSCGYRRDYYRHLYARLPELDVSRLYNGFDELWLLALKQAYDTEGLYLTGRSIDMRYFGQHYQLNVPLPGEFTFNPESLTGLFHDYHQQVYGYNLADLGTEIEITGLSIVVRGKGWQPPSQANLQPSGHNILKGSRRACLEEVADFMEVPVYDGDNMPAGYRLYGPALVEQRHSTIVVPANFIFTCE